MHINGTLIRDRRKNQHMTQHQLAKKAACTQPVICQLENGCYHHKINLVVIENVCKTLLLDINQVVKSKESVKLCQFHDIKLHDVLNNHESVYETLMEIKSVIKIDRDKARYNFLLGIVWFARCKYQVAITILNKACDYYKLLDNVEIDNLISLIYLSAAYNAKGNYALSRIELEKFMQISKLMKSCKINNNDVGFTYLLARQLAVNFKSTEMENYINSSITQIMQKYYKINLIKID